MNIWKLKEKDLRNFSIEETISVIDEISIFVAEQYCDIWTNPDNVINLIETSEDLYSIISILQNKISESAFDEPLPKNWNSKKKDLFSRLFNLIIIVQNIRNSARVRISIDDSKRHFDELENSYNLLAKDYDDKKKELESHIESIEQSIQVTLKEQKRNIETTSDETLEEIRGAEGKIVSHVLTLMGIFSAVITIILSIVVTSSSWLNNATSSSAIIAFIIPNMVTLFAVISIVVLIYTYHNIFYPPLLKKEQLASKTPVVVSSILLITILTITIFISLLAYKYADAEHKPHLRYIISDSDYNIVEIADKETETKHKYFEFTFDEINYQFVFDENKLHQSDIYFCLEHNTLE